MTRTTALTIALTLALADCARLADQTSVGERACPGAGIG